MPFCKDCGAAIEGVGKVCYKCGRPVFHEGVKGRDLHREYAEMIAAELRDPGEALDVGFTTLGEAAASGRGMAVVGLHSDFDRQVLFTSVFREVRDERICAPFPIRSVYVKFFYADALHGYFFAKPLEEIPEMTFAGTQMHGFVFQKDLRTDSRGKPVAPATYKRWVLYSTAEYDEYKRVEASEAKSCFIATAAFEDIDCAEVALFRMFRDDFLNSTPAGRLFVKWYYCLSPPIAVLIRKSRVCRAVTRHMLDVVIRFLRPLFSQGRDGVVGKR